MLIALSTSRCPVSKLCLMYQSLKPADVCNSSFQNINSSVSHIYQKWPNTQISWLGGSKMKLRAVFKILQKQSDEEKQIYFGSCLCLVSLWDLESSGWTGTTDLKRLKAIEWRTVRYRSHRLVISVFCHLLWFLPKHIDTRRRITNLCALPLFLFLVEYLALAGLNICQDNWIYSL